MTFSSRRPNGEVYDRSRAHQGSGADSKILRGPRAFPGGDQQQATQQKTREAVEFARDHGEHVVDEACLTGQRTAVRAQSQPDREKERAADRIENVASKVRDRGDRLPGGQTTRKVTSAATDKIDQVASFLHDRGNGDMLEKVRDFIRDHPTQALIAAGAFGAFLGRKLFS